MKHLFLLSIGLVLSSLNCLSYRPVSYGHLYKNGQEYEKAIINDSGCIMSISKWNVSISERNTIGISFLIKNNTKDSMLINLNQLLKISLKNRPYTLDTRLGSNCTDTIRVLQSKSEHSFWAVYTDTSFAFKNSKEFIKALYKDSLSISIALPNSKKNYVYKAIGVKD